MEKMKENKEFTIAQNDVDIQKMYGSITYESAKVFIKTNIISAAKSFIAIGYYLKYMRDNELYKEDNHANVWEFAQTEYDISKSTASRYMTMNDRFSKDGNSPVIADTYKDFGKSQLQEMLSLNEDQLEQVTPDMPVRDIRKLGQLEESEEEIQIPGQMNIMEFSEFLPDEPVAQAFEPSVPPVLFLANIGDIFPEDVVEEGQEEEIAEEVQQEIAINANICSPYESSFCQYEEERTESEEEKEVVATIAMDQVTHISCGEEVCIQQPEPESIQPELPILKNNDQRATFIDNYETWPLWIETKETEERYYRYDLEDGTSMVVKVYHAMLFDWKASGDRYREGWGRQEYYLLQEGKFFRDCDTNRSTLIDKLKEIQKKG